MFVTKRVYFLIHSIADCNFRKVAKETILTIINAKKFSACLYIEHPIFNYLRVFAKIIQILYCIKISKQLRFDNIKMKLAFAQIRKCNIHYLLKI